MDEYKASQVPPQGKGSTPTFCSTSCTKLKCVKGPPTPRYRLLKQQFCCATHFTNNYYFGKYVAQNKYQHVSKASHTHISAKSFQG